MKYKKRPELIEAMRWCGEQDGKILDWIHKEGGSARFGTGRIFIDIFGGGVHAAERGDFIVKGVDGDFSVMSPAHFELYYEEV